MCKKLLVLASLALLWSAACRTVDTAAEEEAIKLVLKKQTDAFYNRSMEGEAEVWAHEPYVFRGFSIDNVIGWENLSRLYQEVFESTAWPPYLAEHSRFFIHVREDVAWAVYHQVLYIENEQGRTEAIEGWEHRILEKKNGQWRIVLQMNAPYPPPGDAPDSGTEEE